MSDISEAPAYVDLQIDRVWWYCPICGTMLQLAGFRLTEPPHAYELDGVTPVPLWIGHCTWCGAQQRVIGKAKDVLASQPGVDWTEGGLLVHGRSRDD